MEKQRSVFILDRDGVVNYDSDNYVKNTEEWKPIPGSIEAISKLKSFGYPVYIVSNQSGIERKLFTLQSLSEIHNTLIKKLAENNAALDGIIFCPHKPNCMCSCRKPNPGMLNKIVESFPGMNPIYYIGDSKKDIEAAFAAGIEPILVRTGNGKKTESELTPTKKIKIFENLNEAINALID